MKKRKTRISKKLSDGKRNRFQVVLVEPEIPWNTGNVGRTCLGFGAQLHLVGKLGFSLDDRHVKRAGLDYWPRVRAQVHPDVDYFFHGLPPEKLFFFSTHARRSLWDAKFPPGAYLVLGAETRGLPKTLWKRFPDRFFKIPFTGSIRSFNLSTSAGIVLAEAIRQNRSKTKMSLRGAKRRRRSFSRHSG